MKKKSKIKLGFTLLETIISMMIIAIMSIGIYSGFIMLIRNTKDGEVKQRAALIGKQVLEEIRNRKLNLDKEEINFDKYGNIVSENPVYVAKISKERQSISIGNGNKENLYYISDEKITDNEHEIKKDKYKVEKTILIKLNKSETISNKEIGNINFESSSIEKPIYNKYSIWLDFKYLTEDSKITIKVDNESDREFNLYILFNDKKPEIKVINDKGSLNTAYRSCDYSISEESGDLYKITVTVSGKLSNEKFKENLFSADILKNIN